jgi:hypothetical protein
MKKEKLRKLIVDGIARIEIGDERVESICINAEIHQELLYHLLDCFDPYTDSDTFSKLGYGELIGTLFGAHVYLNSTLKEILFIGKHGTINNASLPEDYLLAEEKLDKQNKFKFVYERI